MKKQSRYYILLLFPLLFTIWIVVYYATIQTDPFEQTFHNDSVTGSTVIRSMDPQSLQFSHQGGFYHENFQLSITTSSTDSTIYYTLDGSEPNEQSHIYSKPIPILDRSGERNQISDILTTHNGWENPGKVFKGTVVKAVSYTNGKQVSEVAARSFFVHKDGNDRYSLPIISISTEPDHLFDHDEGIYVPGSLYENTYPKDIWRNPANFTQRGVEWERPIHIEFYEPDGTLGFSQGAGVRIHGNASRANPNKSLRIYARKDYGAKQINYPIFPHHDVVDFKRLVLRTSGNDHNSTFIRDAMMHSLVENTKLETMAYRPVIVFINGEYWGIHNIRERYDKHYFQLNYGIDEDQLDLLEKSGDTADIYEGDSEHYQAMLDYIDNHDLSMTAHYNYIQTQMDIENYIDYQIAEIYFDNTDWPGNNIKFWREKVDYNPDAPEGRDGRWRWLLFDTDFGFKMYSHMNGVENVTHNTLAFALSTTGNDWPNPPWSTFLFRNLILNESFKLQFIERFIDLLETSFEPEFVKQRIRDMAATIQPEIQEHSQRWNAPRSFNYWQEQLNVLLSFAENRPHYVRGHLIDYFQLDNLD